jgi:hypothetical protein
MLRCCKYTRSDQVLTTEMIIAHTDKHVMRAQSAGCAKGSVARISQARHDEALLIQTSIDHASINP